MPTLPASLVRALSSRIVAEDVSVRTEMVELAARLDDVIAMGRGDPDFPTPPHVAEAAKRAIDEGHTHYTHPAGLPPLRAAIAGALARDFHLTYDTDEIIVTAGVQESVMLCMLALVDAGDEVLITSPRFTTYDDAVRMCGGVPVPVPTREEDDFALTVAGIEALLTERSKILVLVSPNNPTGAVTPPDAIRQIAKLARDRDLVVISDEIYAHLIYDGAEHLSIGSLPGMKERTIVLNGFSKSYAMTGWRVGYLAGPAAFVRSLVEPRHTLSINTATPSQHAALAALEGPQDVVTAMRDVYAERRAFLLPALRDLGFTFGVPGGAFYVYANVSAWNRSAQQFCLELLRDARVMLLPGSMFGDATDRYVRMSFLQPLPRIEEAVERMGRLLNP